MIRSILVFFGVPKMWFLNRHSNKAVSLFNKSLTKLKKVNEDILAHHDEHQQTINNAIAAQGQLKTQHERNAKFVSNLENMFK